MGCFASFIVARLVYNCVSLGGITKEFLNVDMVNDC